MKKITIDPITRLEGHGKIEIFLNDAGEVENTYFQVPELRGFEKCSEGRLAEDMPQITQRICGVCPEAHHMAATKALDALFHGDPPSPAKKLRELFYSSFYVTDHTTHFYILGGPDFIMGPDAPVAERNILGVIAKVGLELGGAVIKTRRRNLKNKAYVDMIVSEGYTHKTYYMGMVDANNKVNFYDGKVRVVDPDGKEFLKYAPHEYLENIAEHVEP